MSIPPFKFTCSKSFSDFPCCHRQWNHKGHCKFVHGYSRVFKFWFAAKELNNNGFVVDFSSLKDLEDRLKDYFDHTFLVNQDDPLLEKWKELDKLEAIDLRIMFNVGMEYTAQQIWAWANEHLLNVDNGRTCCWRAESIENESNSAQYEQIPPWYN
tara:strand:+ start:8033 stop:8500 length:468 start_codon:yes stop_codon:yes gene_type:complete